MGLCSLRSAATRADGGLWTSTSVTVPKPSSATASARSPCRECASNTICRSSGSTSHGGIPMTWRRALPLLLLAAVALAVPLRPLAQQPPLFETRKITDNVYLFRYGGHQSMFVVTPAVAIATDPIAQRRPGAATPCRSAVRQIYPPPT